MKSESVANKPGYKHTSVGWIPQEWEALELRHLTDKIMAGIATEVRPFVRNEGIPLIRNQNIKSGYFDGSEVLFIAAEFDEANKNKRVKKGDVVVVRTGSNVGQACVVPEKYNGAQTFTTLIVRASGRLSSNYLSLHINSFGVSEVERLAAGGGKPNLNAGFLAYYKLSVPPIAEQERIATVLSTWDTAIAAEEKLIAALQARHRALVHRLLTGRQRLRGFGGDWRKVKAQEVFKNSSRKNNGDEPLLSATQERGIIPRDMLEGRVTMPSNETASYKLVEPGDFVISLRSFQGGLEYSKYRGIVSPAYTVLKATEPIDKVFYRFYFKSAEFISRLGVAVIGIRDGKQISYEDFCAIKIPFPAFEEQQAISHILKTSEEQIGLHRKALAALQSQKKSLMQLLLTGKLRVRS